MSGCKKHIFMVKTNYSQAYNKRVGTTRISFLGVARRKLILCISKKYVIKTCFDCMIGIWCEQKQQKYTALKNTMLSYTLYIVCS